MTGRRPSTVNVWIRDQIIALLRDRGMMTTGEIQEAIPRQTAIYRASPSLAAHFDVPGTRASFQWEVYPQLAAMARLGIVQRVSVPRRRSVAWMLTAP